MKFCESLTLNFTLRECADVQGGSELTTLALNRIIVSFCVIELVIVIFVKFNNWMREMKGYVKCWERSLKRFDQGKLF